MFTFARESISSQRHFEYKCIYVYYLNFVYILDTYCSNFVYNLYIIKKAFAPKGWNGSMSMFGRGNEYVHVFCFVGVDPHVMMVSISSLACPHLVPSIFCGRRWGLFGQTWIWRGLNHLLFKFEQERIQPPLIIFNPSTEQTLRNISL